MNRICMNDTCAEYAAIKAAAPEIDELEVLCGGCNQPTELTDEEVPNADPAN